MFGGGGSLRGGCFLVLGGNKNLYFIIFLNIHLYFVTFGLETLRG